MNSAWTTWPGSWVTVRYTFQYGCLTCINCRFNRSLQQRRSGDGLSRFTFDAFLTRQASRSRGTRVTRHSNIPFQTHRSLRPYWSVFTRRSLSPGSPSVSWFSPSSSVTFWSWSANYFIFSTDLVLQRAKLFFDEKFYFRDCLDQFLLRSVWWSSLFSWKGLFLICWL